MDNDSTDWWQLARIKNITEEYRCAIRNPIVATNVEKYLFFADYAIWCWAWVIACGDGDDRGRVVVVNGTDDRFVADSFTQFIDRYVVDVRQVA